MPIFIGADPGVKGALAAIKADPRAADRMIGTWDLPRKDGKPDLVAIGAIVRELLAMDAEAYAIVEKIRPFGKNVRGIHKLAQNAGHLESAMAVLGVLVEAAAPDKWQPAILGRFPKGESKAASLRVAALLFPMAELSRKNKNGSTTLFDGRADALCLAEYCRRVHQFRNLTARRKRA